MTRLSRRLLIALALCAPAGTLLAQRGPHADTASEARLCTTVLHGQRLQRTELFFGRNSPSGEISEQDFQGFLDKVVTPLFPDGLTVVDGRGQFRASADSPVEKEAGSTASTSRRATRSRRFAATTRRALRSSRCCASMSRCARRSDCSTLTVKPWALRLQITVLTENRWPGCFSRLVARVFPEDVVSNKNYIGA
jgi:Protein of unknown function (DUF3574)